MYKILLPFSMEMLESQVDQYPKPADDSQNMNWDFYDSRKQTHHRNIPDRNVNENNPHTSIYPTTVEQRAALTTIIGTHNYYLNYGKRYVSPVALPDVAATLPC